MKNDPIVQEIRKIRHEMERECEEDEEAFYESLIILQRKVGERLVCRQPKPLVVEQRKMVG